jgi:hypothetical protein
MPICGRSARTHDPYAECMVDSLWERQSSRPCEDCRGLVVVGMEPAEPEDHGGSRVVDGVPMNECDWCTNLDCPSNHALRGLHRVGVNQYVCSGCDRTLTGTMMSIFAHRRTH